MKTTPDTRPLAERITPGKAQFLSSNDFADPAAVLIEGETIAEAKPIGHRHEMNANAELIAEVFNVTHETGRTPRQLADERAELIASLAPLRVIVGATATLPEGESVMVNVSRLREIEKTLRRLNS